MPTRMPLTLLAIGAAGLLSACASTPNQASLAPSAAPLAVAQQAETSPGPLAIPVEPLTSTALALDSAAKVASAADTITPPAPPEPSAGLPVASAGPALDIAAEVARTTNAIAAPPPVAARPKTEPRLAFSGTALDAAAEVASATGVIKPPKLPAPALALATLEHPVVGLDIVGQLDTATLMARSSVAIALAEAAQETKLTELAAADPTPAPAPARKLPAVPARPTSLAMDLNPLPGATTSVAELTPAPAPVPAPPAQEAMTAPAPQPEKVAEATPPVTPHRRPHQHVAAAKTSASTGEGGPDIPLTFELRR